jgi:hypothetical protein
MKLEKFLYKLFGGKIWNFVNLLPINSDLCWTEDVYGLDPIKYE